jgi:hypothetical protein
VTCDRPETDKVQAGLRKMRGGKIGFAYILLNVQNMSSISKYGVNHVRLQKISENTYLGIHTNVKDIILLPH